MTVSVTLPMVPDRAADEDEMVIVIVLRRVDPSNEGGDPMPDINVAFAGEDQSFAADMLSVIDSLGFDNELSYLSVPSLTDVEVSFGAITATQLHGLIDSGEIPGGDVEPPADAPEESPADELADPEVAAEG